MAKLGYLPLVSDSAVYRKEATGAILASHVDDFILLTKTTAEADEFITDMAKALDLNDLGPLEWFLNVKVDHDEVNGITTISQTAYVRKLLREVGMEDCKAVTTPMEAGILVNVVPNEGKADQETTNKYAGLAGRCIYPSIITRPDIAFAASTWARFMANPSEQHVRGLKRLPRYLQGIQSLAI